MALTEMGERRTNPCKKAADKIKTELTEKLFGKGSLVDPDKQMKQATKLMQAARSLL